MEPGALTGPGDICQTMQGTEAFLVENVIVFLFSNFQGEKLFLYFLGSAQNNMTKAVDAFKKSLKLCVTKEMLLLSITTAYTGLELTFFSGVYGTCIGAVNKFGTEEKSLIGLSGIFIGIGEILGWFEKVFT